MTQEDCFACKVGWHGECKKPEMEAPLEEPGTTFKVSLNFVCCCYRDNAESIREADILGTFVPSVDTKRIQKADEDIKDVTSTGRKRAAILFPLPSMQDGGMVCEWAWLAFAGGGVAPIIGCRGNIIADIKDKVFEEDGVTVKFWPGNVHHGPNKSTLENEVGNVHRICPQCHNRWHALNDPFYGKVRPENGKAWYPLSGEVLQHDKETAATANDLDWSDSYWSKSTKMRESILYRLPKEES